MRVTSLPFWFSESNNSPFLSFKLRSLSKQLITKTERVSMSLCVNIIQFGFVAKITIDAVNALIGIGL